jgi:hypothetical protein
MKLLRICWKDSTFSMCWYVITYSICITDIDDCCPMQCLNGATCVDGINEYSCICAPGYNGTNCEIGK